MSTTELNIATPPRDIDPEWTTASYYINSVLSTAESLGASRHELCRDLNLPENCGDDPEKRLPMSTLIALLELAALRTKNPDFALIIGQQTQPQNHGVLGMLGLCATNMLEGFKLWIPFRYALMHSGNSKMIETKDTIRIIWEPLCLRYIEQRYMVDLIFSNWIGLGEQIYTHKPEPIEVYVTYPEPADIRLLKQRFGAVIHFSQPHNEIVFPRSSFEKPNPQHNPDMLRLMKEYAQKAHESQELTLTCSQQVTLALVDLLPKRRGTITYVAESLSMTERTLQRRLTEEKNAFNDLLRKLRYTQAVQRLTATQQSVTDIALSLGYNDTGSFTKAFRQWTDVSPTEYRHRNAGTL